MPFTDAQQVCLNGHQITDNCSRSPETCKKYCPTCGEVTIVQCPFCQAQIPGYTFCEGVISIHPVKVPPHCHNCGKPYPWTDRKQKVSMQSGATTTIDPILWVDFICSKFHLVAKQIRQRHENRGTLDVQDEYDVQDLLHSLLKIYFDDIRPEECSPSYAGKSSRMDFLIKDYGLVIEVKKTRQGLGAKEIGTQLIDDIARYGKHPDCKILICFVYDPEGQIANPRGIEKDLNRIERSLMVKVYIVPRGY
jgi:hypothetical protein